MNTSSFTRLMPRPSAPSLLRNVAPRLLRHVNPGDIAIRHHYTNERFRLHSFKHRGYWYFGRRREHQTMSLFPRVIANGDFVAEIGGHIGYISVYFASLVGPQGRVVVFEPGPNNLPYLRANVRRRENVRVDSAADVPLNIFCFKVGGPRIQAMA